MRLKTRMKKPPYNSGWNIYEVECSQSSGSYLYTVKIYAKSYESVEHNFHALYPDYKFEKIISMEPYGNYRKNNKKEN